MPAENGHVHTDHFEVLAEGKLADLQPVAPVAEGAELELKLVEVGLHDPAAAVGKVDGIDVVVAGAAKLVGKKAKVVVGRVLEGQAFAIARRRGDADDEPDHLRERGGEADACALRAASLLGRAWRRAAAAGGTWCRTRTSRGRRGAEDMRSSRTPSDAEDEDGEAWSSDGDGGGRAEEEDAAWLARRPAAQEEAGRASRRGR